ncbi:hypothetical protein DF182_15285 [Chitinophaga flava]|uniref:Beta-carotene 15,15'-monooxygenase n=1 Tax=Chitinophaga flava TaxID=2259036 RepID=A0A365Y788_9BACT|nr:hypothetical protein DF182_15285 [Chitinophaga flava]
MLKLLSLLLTGHGHRLTDNVLSGLMADLLLLRVIIMIHGTVKHYRMLRESRPCEDFPELLLPALQQVITNGKISRMLATESTLMYYAFFKWKKEENAPVTSWYARKGLAAVYGIFIFLFLLEMAGMGLLVSRLHYPVLDRILLAAGAYSIVFLVAHLKAVLSRPVQVDATGIYLRYGIVSSVYIPFAQMAAIHDYRKAKPDSHTVHFSLLKAFEPCNLLLELKQPLSLHLLFKHKPAVRQIAFRLDDAEGFRRMLDQQLTS